MKIFTFGSCRTKLNKLCDPNYTIYNNTDFIHTTKGVLMHLDLIYGSKNISDIKYAECLMDKPDLYDNNKYKIMLDDADVVTIEISSLKLLELDNNYYQLDRASKYDYNKIFNVTMLSEEEFEKDVKKIYEIIKKPIIFISHLNFNFYDCVNINGYIASRNTIDMYLKNHCKIYILLKDVFEKYDYKTITTDSNHLSDDGFKILHEELSKQFQLCLK